MRSFWRALRRGTLNALGLAILLIFAAPISTANAARRPPPPTITISPMRVIMGSPGTSWTYTPVSGYHVGDYMAFDIKPLSTPSAPSTASLVVWWGGNNYRLAVARGQAMTFTSGTGHNYWTQDLLTSQPPTEAVLAPFVWHTDGSPALLCAGISSAGNLGVGAYWAGYVENNKLLAQVAFGISV